jgi:hypothetical protein
MADPLCGHPRYYKIRSLNEVSFSSFLFFYAAAAGGAHWRGPPPSPPETKKAACEPRRPRPPRPLPPAGPSRAARAIHGGGRAAVLRGERQGLNQRERRRPSFLARRPALGTAELSSLSSSSLSPSTLQTPTHPPSLANHHPHHSLSLCRSEWWDGHGCGLCASWVRGVRESDEKHPHLTSSHHFFTKKKNRARLALSTWPWTPPRVRTSPSSSWSAARASTRPSYAKSSTTACARPTRTSSASKKSSSQRATWRSSWSTRRAGTCLSTSCPTACPAPVPRV